jgi:1-deoxy-D-xylulose-5-phosphate synthase
MTAKQYPILQSIDSPEDLRLLEADKLNELTVELRQFILDSVSSTGGHLSSNLGTIELTIALHRIFNTPHDHIVWDVGHQSYPHKILTGRRQDMPTLRRKDGLAGFPKRAESPYDDFGVGHSSTSISAALGMSIADKARGIKSESIAVIGDGAMTAGMAFEALNHAGGMDADVIVVLNDNDMSISPNVGGMSNYLTRVLSSRFYSNVREGSKKVLKHMPDPMWELAKRTEEHMKGMVIPGTLFEELGFHYYGPIDGHDLDLLLETLENLKQLKGPRLLHIVTRKGKGYEKAEDDPCGYHGVGQFDLDAGLTKGKKPSSPTYTQVFGDWLCDMAKADSRLMGITPAMREGSGLVRFSQEYPNRYFDVAIAEQHAVTLAAGMACEKVKPVVAIYSTFLQRAYDQLIHDVALQNLPVLFAIDRAGLVGPDGPTHAGSFDLTYLRCIPNMLVMAPADENECRQMLSTGFLHDGPAAVRYPRGKGPGTEVNPGLEPLPIGKAEKLRDGNDIAILMFGSLKDTCTEAAEALQASLINMRFVKPLDTDMIDEIAASHRLIVTVEDNAIAGGAGSAVSEYLALKEKAPKIMHLGLPDSYIDQGEREELLSKCGLDARGIIDSVRRHQPQIFVKDHSLS